MKIAFVSNMVEPTGGDHILFHHVKCLREQGHRADPYFASTHPECQKTLKDFTGPDKGSVFFYKHNNLKQQDFSKYDILVANGLFGANQLRFIDHPKKIWFCQNFDPYVFPLEQRKDIDEVYKSYDIFLTYSHDLAKIIEHYYGQKKFVFCNNGIEYSLFKKYQKKNFKNSKRICFMVVYYRNIKGIKLAEEIFLKLRDKGLTTVEINIVGGPLNNTMEYFRNPVFEKKCKLMRDCDISIHPSVFETWNLVSMEFMALGTPVVGVNSLGIMEYASKENSIIFPKRNPDLICDAILELYDDKDKYLSLQEQGIVTAKEHDWEKIAPNIEKCYLTLGEM